MCKWEMVKLGEVLKYEQPTKYIVASDLYNDEFETPVLTAGKTFVLGYTNEQENVFINTPVIIFDDFTTAIKFVDFPFKVKSSAMKILNPTDKISIKYIYYLMTTIKSDTGLHKRYWISKYAEMQIPLPPLETQKKIADELDEITALIEKRKNQIEKLDLLTKAKFVEMFEHNKFDYVYTQDICEFITKGTTPKSSDIFENFSESVIPFLKVYNLSFNGDLLFDEKPQYIDIKTHENFLKRSRVFKNDVLMNIVGPPLGKFAIITDDTIEYNINQAIAIFRAKKMVNPKYLLFALMQPSTLKPFIESAVGVRQQNLSLLQCRQLQIPLPPLDLQNKFAQYVEQIENTRYNMEKGLAQLETLYKQRMQNYFE